MLLIALNSIAYYAILKLNPTSIYVGALMISNAFATFITLKIKKRPISSLPWSLKELKYLKIYELLTSAKCNVFTLAKNYVNL